jgi:hypothetical protein
MYSLAGDRATVKVDTYPDHPFAGHVKTINPANGAVFALIPPQNASGNWVKVVQSVPVRMAIDIGPGDPVLRNGLSATVTIDIRQRRTLSTLWRDFQAGSDERQCHDRLGCTAARPQGRDDGLRDAGCFDAGTRCQSPTLHYPNAGKPLGHV